MKTFLRLTSAGIPNDYGCICHRVPTLFRDWAVDLEMKVSGEKDARSAVTLYYSSTVCPRHPTKFKGFRLTFNSTTAGEESTITFSENKLSRGEDIAKIKIRNTQSVMRFRLTRLDNSLVIETYDNGELKKLCSASIPRSPYFGYFTISAENIESGDTNDLIAFRTQPLSEYETAQFDESLLITNRKIIETDVLNRRKAKKERRTNNMPRMNEYVQKMRHRNAEQLYDGEEFDIDDAFELIHEAEKRGLDAVTIEQLKIFIAKRLDTTVRSATQKIDHVLERFDESKLDMSEMWSYLREQIVALALEARQSMRNLEKESIASVRDMDIHGLAMEMPDAAATSSSLSKWLFVVAAVEAVAYVVFFVRQYKKTAGFKKVD